MDGRDENAASSLVSFWHGLKGTGKDTEMNK